MRKTLIFRDNSVVSQEYKRIDNDEWGWVKSEPLPFSLSLLNLEVESIDCKFGEFFSWLTASPELVAQLSEIYAEAMGHFPLKAFVEQAAMPFEPLDHHTTQEMTKLEVFWVVDLEEETSSPKQLLAEAGFHGWGRWSASEVVGPIGIEFSPINELLEYKLTLNPEFDISVWRPDLNGWYKYWTGTRVFTLHDIVRGIMGELSWGGVSGHPDFESTNFDNLNDLVNKKLE